MKEGPKIVYLSTYPPRECGIATFTADLIRSMDDLLEPAVYSRVAAVNSDDISKYHYSRKVAFQMDQYSLDEYLETADAINRAEDIKLVNIQHEFGIFGGKYGAHIISFLEALKKPSIITFHSVLPGPNKELYETVRLIAQRSSGLTAMTELSKEILMRDYGLAEEKISVIPHG
ncbi:MAG: glycosyltransferase, partial [Candidatus Omnitrophica bacterium]|nr:glycosyltransferase [Candidatus Omnitrophota bacterium]